MDDQTLMNQLRTLNESELFYRGYRLAKSSPSGFEEYLSRLDPAMVARMALLIPEWPETIKQEYLEDSFFPQESREGLHVFKHNCYTPAIPHSHNFFELFFVLEGRCIHHVRDNHSLLRAGDMCFIQPRVTHALDVSDESIVIDILMRKSTFRHYFYSILQGDNLLSNFFMSTLYSQKGIDYLIFHTGGDAFFQRTVLQLYSECLAKEAYYVTLVNAIMTSIFVQLLRRHMDACELPKDQDQTSRTAIRIARYLQANAATATLAGIAEDFHYSQEYTSRLIKQATGQTFIQMLTIIRMENAEQLLRDTAMPVADVASAVGYDSAEHFIRTFRRHTGETPSSYRQRKQFKQG